MRNSYPILLLLILGCTEAKHDATPTPISVKTPEGNVVAHRSTIEPVPQQIATVTGEKLKSLQSLASRTQGFVATYIPGDVEPTLKECDRAFRAWQTSESPKHSADEVVQILGGFLGNKCIADFDMEWVTVTDEYGTDYAVRGKKLEVMAFPFSTVQKRIDDKEYDFLYGVYYTLKQGMESDAYKSRDQ